MQGQMPNLAYRLFVRDWCGTGFVNRTHLLDDVARRVESGEIEGELLALDEWAEMPGADLDRGTHVDVCMRIPR